jgi:transposase
MRAVLDMIGQEYLRVETYTMEEAMEEVAIRAQVQEALRSRIAELREVIRREQNRLRIQDLEGMPVFDLTEELDWLQGFGVMDRIPSPRRPYKQYSEDLEPLFQNGLITRPVALPNGSRWTAGRLGIPHTTIYRWNSKYARNCFWRPWYKPRKGASLKFDDQDCQLIREALLRDPRLIHKEVNASHVLQILQEIWARAHPQRQFSEIGLQTVRRMLARWGWSRRRAHKRRRPDVYPDAAIMFVRSVLQLLADDVNPGDIVDADETAFLMYSQRFYSWA